MNLREKNQMVRWFILRFKANPSEKPSYFEEWVQRFEGGSPETYMDSESLRLWKEVSEQ